MPSIKQVIHEFQAELAKISFEEARLEAELIWMKILNLSRAELFSYGHTELKDKKKRKAAMSLLNRRLKNEPLAHLIGSKEFFGISLKTSSKALVPRPETEIVVSEALEILKGKGNHLIADVGCGTGAIAISIAKNSPKTQVYALDISKNAINLATENIRLHQLGKQIQIIQSDLLENLPRKVNMLLANLPYIPTIDLPFLQSEVQLYEPLKALDGGINGTELINRFLRESKSSLLPKGIIILEIDPKQVKEILSLSSMYFPASSYKVVHDAADRARVIVIHTNISSSPNGTN